MDRGAPIKTDLHKTKFRKSVEKPIIKYTELNISQGNGVSELKGKKRFGESAEKINSKIIKFNQCYTYLQHLNKGPDMKP